MPSVAMCPYESSGWMTRELLGGGELTKPAKCGWDLASHEDWHDSLTQRAKPDHLCKDISFCLAGMERAELGEPTGGESTQQGEQVVVGLSCWPGDCPSFSGLGGSQLCFGGHRPDTCAFMHRSGVWGGERALNTFPLVRINNIKVMGLCIF